MLNILILHPSFPGQYLYLASYLATNPQNRVMFLAKDNSIKTNIKGVQLGIYKSPTEEEQKWAKSCGHLNPAAEAVLEGQQVVKALEWLKKEQNFVPDIVLGHTGWGSTLYVKDVCPNVPILGYFEWYYHVHKSDSYWWPDEIPTLDSKLSIHTRNAHHLLNLSICDKGHTPTHWQYKQFPEEYKYKLTVVHEGIDTNFCSPPVNRWNQGLVLEDIGLNLPPGTEIITYVARGFEIYRGFPYFMDAIREVLARRPNAHVVLVGMDRICYGAKMVGSTYQKEEEKKGGYDVNRVHFAGLRNRGDYRKILQASSCHVYLTRPFVLSWSFLEAMSFGCPVVSSKTPPVEEVVEEGVNGIMADFRTPHHIARRIEEVLDDKALAERLGIAARETILEKYELVRCLHKQEDLMYSLL